MAKQDTVCIGIQGTVLMLDATTGTEIWRAKLKGSSFVNVVVSDGRVYASARGELFALDAATGKILWNNKLKGLGTDLVTIAGGGQVPPGAKRRQDAEAAAATAAAAAGA